MTAAFAVHASVIHRAEVDLSERGLAGATAGTIVPLRLARQGKRLYFG
jgi:hypothetical protein